MMSEPGHFSDKARSLIDFRFRWKSGVVQRTSRPGFDPELTPGSINSSG